MKEFDKWLHKNYGKLMGGTSFEYNTKEGWKAALKWALTKQGQIDWRFDPVILPKHIEEELKE